MNFAKFASKEGFAAGLGLLALSLSGAMSGQTSVPAARDGYLWNDRASDARFKADILVVVAHPDDETLVTAYLARAIFDQRKHVAVVYGTRGGAGNNAIGAAQAAALGDIREMEARRALLTLGITNVWFLSGRDTVSQNVLYSLEHWGHGACLDELVRIMRLTRPSVVLTFLPDFTTGENHADHQAAGVLATEAFDLAGDPSVLAEQISPAPGRTQTRTSPSRSARGSRRRYTTSIIRRTTSSRDRGRSTLRRRSLPQSA